MIQYRRYSLRTERYYGIFVMIDDIQPTLDIYTGNHAHVFFIRRKHK